MKSSFIGLLMFLFLSQAFAFNAEIGEEINETCAGCHGEFGEGGKDGEYPRVAGLPFQYLKTQLELFKSRERLNIPMAPYTKERELPNEDIIDVSGYLSGVVLLTKVPAIDSNKEFDAYARLKLSQSVLNIPRFNGDFDKGKKIYFSDCKSCHGKAGEGKARKGIPLLAGQYTKYLKKQIINYQKRKRIHDEEELEDNMFLDYTEEDIHNLLSFLSILDD
mgnify:CR=1 FL=1